MLDRGVSWEQALAKRGEAAWAGMDEATDNEQSAETKIVQVAQKVVSKVAKNTCESDGLSTTRHHRFNA